MSALTQFKIAFNLLKPKSRLLFMGYAVSQIILGAMDLAAVAAIGIFSFALSSYLGYGQFPSGIKSSLAKVGIQVVFTTQFLLIIVLLSVLLLLIRSLLTVILLRKTFLFLATENAAISKLIAGKFMSSSYSLITNHSSQEVMYAIGRGLHLSELLGNASILVSEIIMLFFLFSLVAITEPILSFTMLGYFAFIFLVSQKFLGRWSHKNSVILSDKNVEGDRVIQEGMFLYRELYTLGAIDRVLNRFGKVRLEASKSTANALLISYIPKFTFESALVVGACIIGAQAALMGTVQEALVSLALFFAVGSRVLPSLLRLQLAANAIQSFSGALSKSFDLISAVQMEIDERNLSNEPDSVKQNEFEPRVKLENVDFTHNSDHLFSLRDISFEVPPGSSLALVGRSGSGKSTIVNLILGILSPEKGDVTVSGKKPSNAVKIWPGSIGFVPQEVAFVNGTIGENIGIGRFQQDLEEERIWKCLENVALKDFVLNLPKGLDEEIGERGIRLSGGQRQRLGIARALYSNPSLLILDEATSALDVETEKALTNTLNLLSHQMTLIIVAHRLTTARSMNQVIYLDKGRILGKGSFEEVRARVPGFEKQVLLTEMK